MAEKPRELMYVHMFVREATKKFHNIRLHAK